jgi:nicotinate-nucleotide adenylyltransferase
VKLGVFGGTFDPIHNGHLAAARAAADAFGLDRVLMIPSGTPPHKRAPAAADFEDRYRMVALACQSDPRLVPSRLEAPAPDQRPRYSVETVQRIRREGPRGQEIFFIVGADAFAEINTWHRWRELLELAEIVVVPRPGAANSSQRLPAGAKVHWLTGVDVPVSSTEIRERLRKGEAVEEYLPPAVAGYLRQSRLYSGDRQGAAAPR